MVAFHVRADLGGIFSAELRHQLRQTGFDGERMLGMDLNVCCLSLHAGKRLVDHHLAVGQHAAFPLCTRSQQHRPHRGSLSYADRGNVTTDVVHGIQNGKPRRDQSAGRVDVERDIFSRVLCFQKEKLCDHTGSLFLRDRPAEQHDTVAQQA